MDMETMTTEAAVADIPAVAVAAVPDVTAAAVADHIIPAQIRITSQVSGLVMVMSVLSESANS
jgi:hypothetical protein